MSDYDKTDRLFDLERDPPPTLPPGKRQLLALGLLEERGKITPQELGLELHVVREAGYECSCNHGEPCQWADRDGLAVLLSLADRFLVRKDKDEWRLIDTPNPLTRGRRPRIK